MKLCMICLYTTRTYFVQINSLGNQFMNLYLMVSERVWSTSQIVLLHFQRGWSNVLSLLF